MLAQLTAGAVEDARERERIRPLGELRARLADIPPALDVLHLLAPRERVHVIAEIKRASPSRGPLAELADPAAWAQSYEQAGASMISVLTEGRSFGGSLADLEAVRAAVSIPILRKDFIATEYQVVEARAAGADAVLLIVAALDDAQLRSLSQLAAELGMIALVETHSESELDRAIAVGSRLVGINARNLDTFELDQRLFGQLAPRLPAGVIKVAESAVFTSEDVRQYRAGGADAVLVGEALVTGNPRELIASFLEAS